MRLKILNVIGVYVYIGENVLNVLKGLILSLWEWFFLDMEIMNVLF